MSVKLGFDKKYNVGCKFLVNKSTTYLRCYIFKEIHKTKFYIDKLARTRTRGSQKHDSSPRNSNLAFARLAFKT